MGDPSSAMTEKPKAVVLFDMARHRSHLFFRYLGTHPDIESLWHPFLAPFLFGPDRITQHYGRVNEDGTRVEWVPATGDSTYPQATTDYLAALKHANDQGKVLVANEHGAMISKLEIALDALFDKPFDLSTFTNPTNIPDDVFATLTPVFVIRQPVFVLPSIYKGFQGTDFAPGDGTWKLTTMLPLQRKLFDFFHNRDGKPPLVIDGDDVVWRTNEVRDGLSRGLNLPAEGFSDVWKAKPQGDRHMHPAIRAFLKDIDDSTGIERRTKTPPDPDVNKAYDEWVTLAGEENAKIFMDTYKVNQPHYEYLAQFKV